MVSVIFICRSIEKYLETLKFIKNIPLMQNIGYYYK